MDVDEYKQSRLKWLLWLSEMVCPSILAEELGDDFSRHAKATRAAFITHIGLGHLLGVSDADLAQDCNLSVPVVTKVISLCWRGGRVDPLVALHVEELWCSLYLLGRDDEAIDEDVLLGLYRSQVRRQVVGESLPSAETARIRDAEVCRYIDDLPDLDASGDVESERVWSWECPGSHLPVIRSLWRRHDNEAMSSYFTILELLAALPDDEADRWNREALIRASRVHHLYRSLPGGWPESFASAPPLWAREVVTVRGARFFYASAGYVPAVMVVLESEAEVRAMRQWLFEPVFTLDTSMEGVIHLNMLLTFDDDEGDKALIGFRYEVHDLELLAALQCMLAMNWLRIEVYTIDTSNRLVFENSAGMRLPETLVGAMRTHLDGASMGARESLDMAMRVTAEREATLGMMALMEFNLFGNVITPISEADLLALPEVGIARDDFLRVLDAATVATLSGTVVDEAAYERARERLRVAQAKTRRGVERLPVHLLGADRAYVQLHVSVESAYLHAFVAWVSPSGDVLTEHLDFSRELDLLSWRGTVQLEAFVLYLVEGMSDMKRLLSAGVRSLVVSAGTGIYNVAFHEVFLRLGFEEVSYTHRLGTLRGSGQSTSTPSAPLVVGHAGEGSTRISCVDVELNVLRRLLEGRDGSIVDEPLPRVVHLAGHAKSGSRAFDVGVWLGGSSSSPISSARVLLDVDARKCELVFLSACSTAAGVFASGELPDALPLDAAFIDSGARTVVATSAPVNDRVACFFACVFYAEWLSGASVWSSYVEARRAARTGRLPDRHANLRLLLSEFWPDWQSDLQVQRQVAPDDWMLFRVAGRHW